MSFPEISSRYGITATDSTSIKNILLSFSISQDNIANLDSMVEAAVETTSQKMEENKKKKEQQIEASKKDSTHKNKIKYMKSIKNKRNFTFVRGKDCVPVSQLYKNDDNNFSISASTSTSTAIQPVPVIEEHVLPVRKS